MNKSQFWAMARDLKEHPENLPKYREIYRNVYPFSDGIFKMLMANEGKPERTIKFLNAMLGLTEKNAITEFTLGVQEQPGILDNKTAIFDIYGYNQAKEPVLIEVQQNYNELFVDRLVYYTSRIVNNQVKKSQSYDLPHIYVLSLLVDDQFPLEADTYFHQYQFMRNRKYAFKKLDVYLVEMTKFFRIEDRLKEEKRYETRKMSPQAEMLRLFRDVLEDKTIDEEKAERLLDKDFAKDVNFKGYTDELLLLEVDNMTDMLYEKQGSYLQGKREGREEGRKEGKEEGVSETKLDIAKAMLAANEPIKKICAYTGMSENDIIALKDA
ncbi:MAG: Rpn family recombination-promoting nuclease/putative transposase [Fibrobacter sp.]|nr:Rpn family recombination-promoting nuclease/putative transposase [Fibrobacter sp.]